MWDVGRTCPGQLVSSQGWWWCTREKRCWYLTEANIGQKGFCSLCLSLLTTSQWACVLKPALWASSLQEDTSIWQSDWDIQTPESSGMWFAYQPCHLWIIQVISHFFTQALDLLTLRLPRLLTGSGSWVDPVLQVLPLTEQGMSVPQPFWGYRIWNTFAVEGILWCFYSPRCYVKPQNRHSYFAGSFTQWIVWIQCSEVFGVIFLVISNEQIPNITSISLR